MNKSGWWLGFVLAFSLAGVSSAQFDFESPELGAPTEEERPGDIALGSFGSLSFGGLFDVRYISAGEGTPGTMIHVDELVLTANIGDNISILAEQLLPTARLAGLENVIGDDHGFVYAIFSNIPHTPLGTAFKIGRFRFKWGIDAVLDSPANPIYPLTRKNLGFITDRGIELAGFFGAIDYSIGLADGPEFVLEVLEDEAGNAIGTTEMNVENSSLPLLVRVSTNTDFSQDLRFGLSYFDGKSWPYLNFMPLMPDVRLRVRVPGGMADRTQLADRQHGALDVTYKWKKWDLNLEYSLGEDRFPKEGEFTTAGYFARLDYTVKPQKLGFLLQYDSYDDGRPDSEDEQAISLGVQAFIHDQAYVRLGYIFSLADSPSDLSSLADGNVAFVQFYLPF